MAYIDEVLADSPRNLWLLDETSGTVADDYQNATDGTYVNTPTLGATGLITDGGTAVTFAPGPAQHVTFATTLPAAPYSVEIWFKWSSGVAIGRDNSTANGTILGFDNAGTFAVRTNSNTLNTSKTTAQVRDGNRHHLVITKAGTGANQLTVYLDGVQIAQGTSSGTASNTSSYRLARNGGLTEYSDLTADAFAIYTTALSSARVTAHYDAGIATGGATYEDLSVSLAASSDLTTALNRVRPLSITLDAASDLTAALNRVQPLAAALDASSDLAATLARVQPLAAAFEATGDLTAALEVVRFVEMAASLDATSDLTANASAILALAASLDAEGTLDASLAATRALAATLDVDSALTAHLSAVIGLATTLDAEAVLTASLTIERVLGVLRRLEPMTHSAGRLEPVSRASGGVEPLHHIPGRVEPLYGP